MLYKTYGSTGIDLSVVGFGGMRFEKVDDPEISAGLVKAAYDAGINYFDTAPGYHGGKSEEVFGVAFEQMLKTRAERPFYVSTKTMADNPDSARQELERSLKRMRVDCIDFYHVWCILEPKAYAYRKSRGVLREFERMKNEGLIKRICVSTHMTGPDVAEMLADYPFEGVLLGYSIMNFAFRESGIDRASQLGKGVVVMNPLGGGIIPKHPELFDFVRMREGATVVEGALRFLINDRRITVALVGFGNQEHLREAISAVEGYEPIPEEMIRQVRNGLREGFNQMCTGCGYCKDCPQGIPVPKLMDAYNQQMITGNERSITDRLAWHWGMSTKGGGPWEECTECGLCEEQCTQKLPVRERIKAVAEAVEARRKADSAS